MQNRVFIITVSHTSNENEIPCQQFNNQIFILDRTLFCMACCDWLVNNKRTNRNALYKAFCWQWQNEKTNLKLQYASTVHLTSLSVTDTYPPTIKRESDFGHKWCISLAICSNRYSTGP